MDNLKCLSDYVFAHASVDFIDACETLRKELLKSMKIAKKFKEKLKLTILEKEELIVRLDESNKNNEFLNNKIINFIIYYVMKKHYSLQINYKNKRMKFNILI